MKKIKDKYTLVTCIGTAGKVRMDGDQETIEYNETNYIFDDQVKIKKKVFSTALLEKYKGELSKVIVIGTENSSWNTLLPEEDASDSEINLWINIEAEVLKGKKLGLQETTKRELEEALCNCYGIEFKLLVHSSNLSEDNIDEISNTYSDIYEYIDKDTKLLIDVTNGFRYMPIMLIQSLQIRGNYYKPGEVLVLYGEYGAGQSFVRNITSVWEKAEINKQFYSFCSSCDGIPLGNTLKLYDETKLGDWIINFSDMVQKNYVMQIGIAVRQLKNVLDDIKFEPELKWVRHVIEFLKSFYAKFEGCNKKSQYLLVFSYILWYEMGLTTQAIIALREALYAKLFEFSNDIEYLNKYISTSNLQKKDYYQGFKVNCISKGIWWEAIEPLNRERNNIAHAALEINERYFGHSIIDFDKYYNAVKIVFEDILKK